MKRKALLAKKRASLVMTATENETLEHKIKNEITSFIKLEPIETNKNPLKWYREHETEFPYLARYVKHNAHFQPTSVASERIFNKDSLIYDSRRSSLAPENSRRTL